MDTTALLAMILHYAPATGDMAKKYFKAGQPPVMEQFGTATYTIKVTAKGANVRVKTKDLGTLVFSLAEGKGGELKAKSIVYLVDGHKHVVYP